MCFPWCWCYECFITFCCRPFWTAEERSLLPSSKSPLHFSLFIAPSFPVFKPEELRQALMPTLESLYRQDPESLPFRQPVDPQLLGIPVRIRTSNKTNLVRDCAGCHFASSSKHSFVFVCFPLLPQIWILFYSSYFYSFFFLIAWKRLRKIDLGTCIYVCEVDFVSQSTGSYEHVYSPDMNNFNSEN